MRTFASFAAAGSYSPASTPNATSTPPIVLSTTNAHFDVPELTIGFYSVNPIDGTIVFARAAQAMSSTDRFTWRTFRWIGSGLYDDGPLDFISGFIAAFGNPQQWTQGCLQIIAVAPGHPPSTPILQPFAWHSS